MDSRQWAMFMLGQIWADWCLDPTCPNNPFYGVKPGSRLRTKLPDASWRDVGLKDQAAFVNKNSVTYITPNARI
jgi:hypothetical protein